MARICMRTSLKVEIMLNALFFFPKRPLDLVNQALLVLTLYTYNIIISYYVTRYDFVYFLVQYICPMLNDQRNRPNTLH